MANPVGNELVQVIGTTAYSGASGISEYFTTSQIAASYPGGLPTANGGTGGTTGFNKRLALPERLLARQVMASPPTVTQAATSQYNASITGTISGTTLTVVSVVSGSVQIGESVTGTGVTAGTVITAGSGTSWTLSQSSTVGTATAMTCSSFLVAANAGSAFGGQPYVNSKFTYTGFSPVISGTSYLFGNNVTQTITPTYNAESTNISFYHDGQILEIWQGSGSAGMFIKVDDAYINLTGISTGSSTGYTLINFGSVARRRIDIIGFNLYFGGVNIGQNDSIDKAPIRGPRVIVLGDSWTLGILATQTSANNFVRAFADQMGWDDVWASGVSGTGYVNNFAGAAPTFGGRVAHDVIAYNPDIVIVAGSVNDDSYPAATVGTAASSLYATLKSSLPNAFIAAAYFSNGGVNGMTTNKLQVKAAMKSAATANAVAWLDLTEYPLTGTPFTGTVAQNISAGQSNFNFQTSIPANQWSITPGCVVEFDTGLSTQERVEVKSFTYAGTLGGYYMYQATIDGTFQYAHAFGDTSLKQVGNSFWTGHGLQGSLTGYGNCDLYVSNNNNHPTTAGHTAIGSSLAFLFCNALAPQQNI